MKMFKFKRYDSGLREFYIGKTCVFKYRNLIKGAIYSFRAIRAELAQLKGLKQDLINAKNEIKGHTSWAVSRQIPEGIQSKEGIYYFQSLLRRSYVSGKYYSLFYDFRARSTRGEELVFIDGGAHAGVFSDVVLACGGHCYAFEPNVYLASFLKELYKNNDKISVYQQALGIENKKAMFYNPGDDLVSQGAGVVKIESWGHKDAYEVEIINFCEFLQNLISKHGKITLVKLDIEGAEFEILEQIIHQKLYKHIEYIMAETHERAFSDGALKMQRLKNLIESNRIKNIYLDWI